MGWEPASAAHSKRILALLPAALQPKTAAALLVRRAAARSCAARVGRGAAERKGGSGWGGVAVRVWQ